MYSINAVAVFLRILNALTLQSKRPFISMKSSKTFLIICLLLPLRSSVFKAWRFLKWPCTAWKSGMSYLSVLDFNVCRKTGSLILISESRVGVVWGRVIEFSMIISKFSAVSPNYHKAFDLWLTLKMSFPIHFFWEYSDYFIIIPKKRKWKLEKFEINHSKW